MNHTCNKAPAHFLTLINMWPELKAYLYNFRPLTACCHCYYSRYKDFGSLYIIQNIYLQNYWVPSGNIPNDLITTYSHQGHSGILTKTFDNSKSVIEYIVFPFSLLLRRFILSYFLFCFDLFLALEFLSLCVQIYLLFYAFIFPLSSLILSSKIFYVSWMLTSCLLNLFWKFLTVFKSFMTCLLVFYGNDM